MGEGEREFKVSFVTSMELDTPPLPLVIARLRQYCVYYRSLLTSPFTPVLYRFCLFIFEPQDDKAALRRPVSPASIAMSALQAVLVLILLDTGRNRPLPAATSAARIGHSTLIGSQNCSLHSNYSSSLSALPPCQAGGQLYQTHSAVTRLYPRDFVVVVCSLKLT